MFFTKYARAIDDTRERRSMKALYIAQWVFLILLVIAVIFLAATASVAGDLESEGDDLSVLGEEFFLVLLIIGELFIVAADIITASVLAIVFAVKFDRICKRPQTDGETPAVYNYRTEYLRERASVRKYTGWASAVFALSAVACIALVLYDVLFAEAESSLYPAVGGVVLAFGAVVYFLALYLKSVKDAANGKAFAMRVEDDTKIIDELQGRPHRYSVTADKNAQTVDLLYPDETLRARAQKLSRINITATLVTTCITVVLYFTAVVIEVFALNSGYIGYYFPAFFTSVCIICITVALCVGAQTKNLDAEQEKLLCEDTRYEKNAELFRAYKRFGKKYGMILPICLGIGIATGFVLAAFFPSSYLSMLSVVPSLIGIIIYNAVFKKFRLSVIPIENEIRNEENISDHISE